MRRAGVLLPLFSLPSPCGIGAMGREAEQFIDFLERAGQSVWQLLPICPTSYGDSPYQSFSTFAGNPYLIDLPCLAEDGLLEKGAYQDVDWDSAPDSINYGALYEKRFPILRAAVERLLAVRPPEYDEFCTRSAFWLEDYALFMALKDDHGGLSWQRWAEPLRRREEEALSRFRREHASALTFWRGVQFLFFRQWERLKDCAHARGISLLGDLPIYVAEDSAEVWAHPEVFQLDGTLHPAEVAGCPPDGFSADGQLWGNPLFDWDAMAQNGYAWWRERVAYQLSVYDLLRIDHFRGLAAYYAIPAMEETARNGRWRQGPGRALLDALGQRVDLKRLIAEDLGFLDDEVRALLRQSGLPGMKVLEFAFDSREDSDYLPHNYEKHCVVYTGTHDNDTALGWMAGAPAGDAAKAKAYLRLTQEEGWGWGLMRGAWASVGELAVVQMQDLLEKGGEARMNTPSTLGENWKWRLLPGELTEALSERIRAQMELYQRLAPAHRAAP